MARIARTMHERDLLGVFAKEPVAGRVKTRLAAATSPEFAARVAEAMLRDTIALAQDCAARKIIAFAPPTARDYFTSMTPAGFTLEAQCDGDLGQRLARFFERHRKRDERIVVIGSDSPTMPREFLLQAFDALADADVVLGPATDGGYYLIGSRVQAPRLFEDIAWSGPNVFADTVDRVRELGLTFVQLPMWYDIDTLEDLTLALGDARGLLAALDIDVGKAE